MTFFQRGVSAILGVVATWGVPVADASAGNESGRYPHKAITIVVPFGPGTTDQMARFIGKSISEVTGQPVVVENKPGADGMIGIQEALKRPADGYTLVIGSNTTFAANKSLYKKLPYDPLKDFLPVCGIATGGVVFAVAPDFPARNVAEFVDLAKRHPGKYTFGAANASSRGGAESMRLNTGVDILYINYKSIPAALTDLIGGQIDMVFSDMPPALPLIKSGKLRALGVSSKNRIPGYEEIPTIAEQGYPEFIFRGWAAVYSRVGTPVEIVEKLNSIISKAMKTPEAQSLLSTMGWEEMSGSPEDLALVQREDTLRWASLVKSAGIEPN